MPPIDSRWRLTADLDAPDFKAAHDNEETLYGEAKYEFDAFTEATRIKTSGIGSDWVPQFREWKRSKREAAGLDGVLPAGTVIQIERYHVSRSGENQITAKVLISPARHLTPKKMKGSMRGAGRIYFYLHDFNLLDLEPFTETM